MKMKIQQIPVSDSPNNDAFEAVVEVFYQTQGYITSAGKWFWVWKDGKKQRGYQDIDVLAVNGDEVVIVSVTSNLDDKVNTKGGIANTEMLERLKEHFKRVCLYLKNVPEYKWMVCGKRRIRNVVAYNHAFKRNLELVKQSMANASIEVISAEEILKSLREHAGQNNLKIQNQMLRTIQLLGENAL